MIDTIKSYLSDNTELPDSQINELAHEIENHLDYSPIYDQIDYLLKQFAYSADYLKAAKAA